MALLRSNTARSVSFATAILATCLYLTSHFSHVRGYAPVVFLSRGRSDGNFGAQFFQARATNRLPTHRLQMAGPANEVEATIEDVEQAVEEEATLVLKGEYSCQSEVAPISPPQAMFSFFEDPVNRMCLISGGYRLEVETIESTIGLIQKWREQALRFGTAEPDLQDVILSVRTGGLQLPGINIISTAQIGSKLLAPSDSSIYPSYEFITIGDKTEATGLKPVVWIFNQLTGAGKKDAGQRTTASSVSRFTVQPSDDRTEIKFDIQSNLEVRVKFPKLLLRILPVSKEKAEQQGGDAIVKALTRDVDCAMTKFYEFYCAAIKKSSTSNS